GDAVEDPAADRFVAEAPVSCNVKRTISSTFSRGIDGLRPRPRRTLENSFSPTCANRSRQRDTVAGAICTSSAIRVLANPSAAINNTRARWTSRYGAVCERNSFSKTDRCSSLTASGGVGRRMPHHNPNIPQLRDTPLAEMTWPQIQALVEGGETLCVLPVGATEQHGRHLATGTDTIIAEAICRAASTRTDVPVLPALSVGSSNAHTSAWPGTLS